MHAQMHFKQVALAFAAGVVTATLLLTPNSWATPSPGPDDVIRAEREARTAAAKAITAPSPELQDLTY